MLYKNNSNNFSNINNASEKLLDIIRFIRNCMLLYYDNLITRLPLDSSEFHIISSTYQQKLISLITREPQNEVEGLKQSIRQSLDLDSTNKKKKKQ